MQAKPCVLIVEPILARVRRVQAELGDRAEVLAAANMSAAIQLAQGRKPFLVAVSLHQGVNHGLFVGKELRTHLGSEALITVYGRPAGKKVGQKGREKVARMYKVDSFVPADLTGPDIAAICWAHLKEAAREAARLDAGGRADDTSLHGDRSWSQILGNPEHRAALRGLDGGSAAAEVSPEDPGLVHLLKQPVSAGAFKRLMTAEIVRGKDLPEDGSMPSIGDILQTRVSAANLRRLVRGKKDGS